MKPSVAFVRFTGCSGCQLTLLNLEAELPALLNRFRIEVTTIAEPPLRPRQWDVVLVEGAVSCDEERLRLEDLRKSTSCLVAVGACAVWGGIFALRSDVPRGELVKEVYGTNRLSSCDTRIPQPLARFVAVDGIIPGCPPEKEDMRSLMGALLRGVLPEPFPRPVCSECRERENRCLLMEDRAPCLGPVTEGGCGARCPSIHVPCEGCRGPVAGANRGELEEIFLKDGDDDGSMRGKIDRFGGWK